MKKYLIINADDFGISPSVNNAIINLLNKNKISSATLMPNAKHYKEAAIWAKDNSQNVGLHITLVNGGTTEFMSSMTRVSSIEDKNGYLFTDKYYFMKNFKFKELKREIDSQFNRLRDDGIKFSHVDTHRYSIYPTYNPFAYMYLCKKCKEYAVPTRWCREGSYFVGEKFKTYVSQIQHLNFLHQYQIYIQCLYLIMSINFHIEMYYQLIPKRKMLL